MVINMMEMALTKLIFETQVRLYDELWLDDDECGLASIASDLYCNSKRIKEELDPDQVEFFLNHLSDRAFLEFMGFVRFKGQKVKR